MQQPMQRLWAYVLWINRFCFESVLVGISFFSVLYGVRILLLHGLYSYPSDTVILVEQIIPIGRIAGLLIFMAVLNIAAVYTGRRLVLTVSLYGLTAVWVMLAVSFLCVNVLSLHSLIAAYTATLYSWALWRARGLTFRQS